jgi:transcriptional regulator with XRE-family HTH domain
MDRSEATRGQRLAAALTKYNLSQGELARRMEVSRPVISNVISGAREVSTDWLILAAREIPCDIGELEPTLRFAAEPAKTGPEKKSKKNPK